MTEVAGERPTAEPPEEPALMSEGAGERPSAQPPEDPAAKSEVVGERPPAAPSEEPAARWLDIKEASRYWSRPSHMWYKIFPPMCSPLSCMIARHDRHYRPP